MQAPELAVEEMKRAAVDLKMPGFQIGSHVGDWNLDAKELYPIYKTAEELGTALFVHPWGMYPTYFYFCTRSMVSNIPNFQEWSWEVANLSTGYLGWLVS